MPNFLAIESEFCVNLFQFPTNRKEKKGGGGGMSQADMQRQYALQRDLMREQLNIMNEQQLAAEERFRADEERQRQLELQRKEDAAAKLAQETEKQNRREQTVAQEAAASTGFGSGVMGEFNLSRPVIERPDYEVNDRPI
jgi:hypothetical protein